MILRSLFDYNWQVRNDWFAWCAELPQEELVKKRHGGMQTFIHTLYHVIYCEHIWVSQLGQMSVWARAIGRVPVNCDLLPRDVDFPK